MAKRRLYTSWLTPLLEEASYKTWIKEQPGLVDAIRKLLAAGESPNKIKQFMENKHGKKNITTSLIWYLIDYINKQQNN